jgi:dUTPase
LYNYYSKVDNIVDGKLRYSSGLDLVMPTDSTCTGLRTSCLDFDVVVLLKQYGCDQYSGFRLLPRSSTGKNTPIRFCSGGVIDLDYRGTLKAYVDNVRTGDFTAKKGEKYFQVVAPNMLPFKVEMLDTLPSESDNGRCTAGFGSSNTNTTSNPDLSTKPQAPTAGDNNAQATTAQATTAPATTAPVKAKGNKRSKAQQVVQPVQDQSTDVPAPVQDQQVQVQSTDVPAPAPVKAKRTRKAQPPAQSTDVQATDIQPTDVQPVVPAPVKAKRTRKAQPPAQAAVQVQSTDAQVNQQSNTMTAQARQIVDQQEYDDEDNDTIDG